MVRLKDTEIAAAMPVEKISIPYGAIKSYVA